MPKPEVQVAAISNVFSRLMHFVHKGDVEIGHVHTYDHATLVSSGSVLYEVLDGEGGNTVASKKFKAPGYVFVEKNKYHRLTALEDNTVCVCIHALRTIDEEIVSPDFFVSPVIQPDASAKIKIEVYERTGKYMQTPVPSEPGPAYIQVTN